MEKYLLTREEIDAYEGIQKIHFLNDNARRTNKSLGDLTGLTGFGFHLIEIEPGRESTERHRHYHEDECVYVLDGQGEAVVGDETFAIKAGDFLGYRAGGQAHKLINTGASVLRCIVVGERRDHDVADYPDQNKRIFRNRGMEWNLVDKDAIAEPNAGKKI
ncbi:cupin 2, barrel [Alcanivorax hongdengensis A-11-3]|uniref:Cupin 2, barrel n=1 Tax=Alcanivorax hongdengensis A-11-3 TaxID=1177179 RepID=L0WCA1_9GAMM|nr:cupin domain-containing protein [Alcanivorax hongdengensis]EKF74581.1 cupin 2, barrel [Alcanivorax hongdengensis A-11-3]